MRLLFFFSDTGGGHRSAATAVRDCLQDQATEIPQITLIDIFKALPWPFPHVPALWPQMIKLRGLPWALFYHLTDHRKVVASLARAVWPAIASSLKEIVAADPADAIVSFHPLANDVLSLANRAFGNLPPMMSVSQDLVNVHAATFAPDFAYHTVPTVEARTRALRCDVDPAQLHVTGVPTRARFTELMNLPRSVARARLALTTTNPVILFIGGRDGSGPLIRVVRAVARMTQHEDPALVAFAGHNQRLIHQLRALSLRSLQVKGFVPEMALWMRAADVLVTKAGPNTLAEAFITGCPIVLTHAIPGQESGNVRYVVDHGAGLWRPNPTCAAESIRALLADPARREAMVERARTLARPQATARVAETLRVLVEQGPKTR